MTISETKTHVREQIDEIIKDGMVKNDAQIAREMGISKSAISSILSLHKNKYLLN